MIEATLRVHDGPEGPAASETAAATEFPSVGTRMGRYVVLSSLGMGSMGVVVVAYDPELDRKAALKLLRRRDTSNAAHARLTREAQALAKLNHPSVVTLYDVGVHAGRVFVAMEFVQGTTLSKWLEAPRRWADVVRVFVAAGEGLAAAHEVGLVHRDFKPDNVMIDAHERVRVMDFGLARVRDGSAGDESLDEPSELDASPHGSLRERLTRTGALVGTPAYRRCCAGSPATRPSATPRCETCLPRCSTTHAFAGAVAGSSR